MNPEVKKIFVLFNELIQNQSDNILLLPCLKLPNSNSRVFLRNKLTNRRPSKYQYILTFEDLLKLKETDIVDSCNKVIGHCANHSGSPGFEVYLNKTMLFSVWTYQELADALSIFEDNVKKRLKVVCGELTIKAIYVLEKKWRYYIERKNSLTENEPMLSYLWNTPVFSNKDGTVMFRYKNTPANFWSSNAWNPETNMFVGNFNEKIRKY